MSDDMFYARVCQERDQLRAELEKLRCELDDAEERASEAEERCAAEWEKDCGQALRLLGQVTKFEWEQDGSPADEVREHIQITIESLEKQVVALRAELAAAKNLLASIHRDGGHHTEAVGVVQSIADADGKVSEWLLASEDRGALAAAEIIRESGKVAEALGEIVSCEPIDNDPVHKRIKYVEVQIHRADMDRYRKIVADYFEPAPPAREVENDGE